MLHAPFLSLRPEPPDRREAPRGDIALLEVAPRTGWGKVPRGFAKAISKLPKDDVLDGPVVKNLSFHARGSGAIDPWLEKFNGPSSAAKKEKSYSWRQRRSGGLWVIVRLEGARWGG